MADEKPLPSWEEVKKLLDDPAVPDDQKRNLALAYAAEDDFAFLGVRDEVEPYLEKYDDGYWRVKGESWSVGDRDQNLRDRFDEAKKSADAAAEARRKQDEAVENGKGTLEDSKRKAENGDHGGAGAKSADELLDAGKPGMKFFDTWIPLYEKIEGYYENRDKVPSLDEVKKRYNEQRGLNFDKFAKNIEDLNAAEKGMRDSVQTMSDKLSSLWKSWTGAASQASQDFYSSKFHPTAQERVITTVSDAASMTQDTVKAVAEMIRGKAEAVLGYNEQVYEIAGKAKSEWEITVQVGNGTDDDMVLKQACSIWDVPIEEDCGDLTDEVKDQIEKKCREVTRSAFCDKGVEAVCEAFTKLCDDTKEKIDEAWKKLNEELGKAEENPFKNPGGKDDGDKPGGEQPRGQQDGGNGTGGGGGTPGGGGGTPGGGGGIPKPPEAPEMPDVPEAPEPPEMPTPGEGGAGAGEREKVTLGEGENAVSVGAPGPDGKTTVELVGPDGQPKTYEVDFGGQGGLGQPVPGQPGVPGQPIPGAPGGAQTMPAPGEMPPGMGSPGQGGQGPIPVQPGEDGKAVIREGDRTITLERTPTGEIKVSVDNGGGQPPLNQTIDFGNEQPNPPFGGPEVVQPAGFGEPVRPEPVVPEAAVGTPPPVGTEMPPPDMSSPLPPPDAGAGSAMPTFDGGPAVADGVTTMPAAGGPAPAMVDPNAPAATTPQAAGLSSFTPVGEGVQNSFGSASGQLFDSGSGQPGAQTGSTGLSSFGASNPPSDGAQPQGATGLSSFGGEPGHGQPSGQQGTQNPNAAAGGGGMMGGGMMGAMGGAHGAQQGGDQERTNASPWRTQGQLFDDGVEASNVRFQSVLGQDRDR
ncbi:hypothetical protein [Saccharopolyspora hordei]|uniref:Uncharacterized protein YukE n=1 Tax=Saccharopolyspora hordei TaxID=1838 RepID=A0A853AHJ6_9PSEU|nr:hypothetical protein [Saccharopolyspora hordei]NYI82579.1 uncharacterized protein YukE [Saccharopolyspora hordei]